MLRDMGGVSSLGPLSLRRFCATPSPRERSILEVSEKRGATVMGQKNPGAQKDKLALPPVGTRNRYHVSFWRFLPCYIAILGPIGANPGSEADCGVVTFSLVL